MDLKQKGNYFEFLGTLTLNVVNHIIVIKNLNCYFWILLFLNKLDKIPTKNNALLNISVVNEDNF